MKLGMPVALVLALAAVLGPAPAALAATGSDVAFGYTWRDNADGAVRDGVIFGGAYGEILGPADEQVWGPFTLDIANAFPFYGNSYTEFWISDNGWISFVDPAGNPHPGPGAVPDAASGPPEMIAAFWGDLELRTGSLIRYGYTNATIDAYRIQFAAWDVAGNQAVGLDLLLFPDGRIKVQYSPALGDVFEGAMTVGIDSDAAGDGAAPVNDGTAATGVNIQGGTVIEFLPPPVLPAACGSLPPVDCGVLDAATATGGPPVFYYGCDPQRWSAEGAVYDLSLTETSTVDLMLSSGSDLRLFVLDGCSEQSCLTGPVLDASLLLGAGDYQLAVDGLTTAEDGPFTLDVNCSPAGTVINCGDAVAGNNVMGPSRWDSYPCAPGVDLSGPEAIYSLTVPMATNLTATISGGSADFDVVILQPGAGELTADECVTWGPDGAVAWNAQPGEYLVVVDGVAGAEGNFDLQTRCDVGINCDGPAGTIDFGTGRVQQVAGDNSAGANSVEIYSCDPGNLYSSPEEIWEVVLDQPGQIAVVQTDGEPLDFFFLTDCNEGSCAGAAGGGACSTPLEPGSYWLVVDGTGASGPYELLLIYEEAFNRWDVCEDPVPPDTEIDTVTSPFWHLTDNAFCKYDCDDGTTCWPDGVACPDMSACTPNRMALGVDCTFAMYVTVDCGTALNLPLYDCEGGHVRIFDVFTGEYVFLEARSPTWGQMGTEIMWQDLDCQAGSDPRWNEVVTNVRFERPEGLCGIFRLEFINHSGNVWELFANCDGTRTPAFNISDSLCSALAGYRPVPNLSITDVTESYDCPDVTVSYEVRNDGCVPARDVEVVLSDGTDIYTDLVPEILPGESLVRMFTAAVPTPSANLQLSVDPNDTVLECDEAGDRSSCEVLAGTDIVNLLGCAASCTVDARGSATPDAICSDGTEPVVLDVCSSVFQACSGLEYAYIEVGSGDVPVFGPDCSWTIDPPPAMDTTYSLIARCVDDPDCNDFLAVDVDVSVRPDFDPASVTARDRTNCNLGVQLTWDAATFHGPSGTGAYNIYRSETGCDTDLELLRIGITDLEFTDTPPLPDVPYYYVVEAEDDSNASPCLPRGPDNGGSTTRVAANGGTCTPIVDVLAQDLAGLPRIGTSLRVGGTDPVFGVRQYGETFVQIFWTPDRPADPLADEHFHVYRSDQPDTGFSTITDDAPPVAEPEFLDQAADQPDDGTVYVWYYLVFSSDGCEGENIDYERFCTNC